MISISTHKIVVTGRGGYNIASLRNLRQNRQNKEIKRFGCVDKSVSSKYRTILTNWFETNFEANRQFSGKKTTAHNKGFGNSGADVSNSSFVQEINSSAKLNISTLKPPPSPSPNPLCAIVPSTIYFQTLTFPMKTSETKAKEMLKKYLAHLRLIGCSHYFWTLERSGVIGDNVHFHLLVDINSLDGLESKWKRITNYESKFGCHSTKINDWRGIIEYILKGHEHERETRQFGMSRSLSDFKPIKLDGLQALDFLQKNENDLRLFKSEQFYTVLIPTAKMRRKIVGIFLVKYMNRKSEITKRISKEFETD